MHIIFVYYHNRTVLLSWSKKPKMLHFIHSYDNYGHSEYKCPTSMSYIISRLLDVPLCSTYYNNLYSLLAASHNRDPRRVTTNVPDLFSYNCIFYLLSTVDVLIVGEVNIKKRVGQYTQYTYIYTQIIKNNVSHQNKQVNNIIIEIRSGAVSVCLLCLE